LWQEWDDESGLRQCMLMEPPRPELRIYAHYTFGPSVHLTTEEVEACAEAHLAEYLFRRTRTDRDTTQKDLVRFLVVLRGRWHGA
jgi:hypothetical protein